MGSACCEMEQWRPLRDRMTGAAQFTATTMIQRWEKERNNSFLHRIKLDLLCHQDELPKYWFHQRKNVKLCTKDSSFDFTMTSFNVQINTDINVGREN